jgi:hypothetical protein
MIKTILDWILGKNDKEAKPAELTAAEAAVINKQIDEALVPAPAPVETKPVTVKAKYKKADLTKKTKAELLELAKKHKIDVKARATKNQLVDQLVKV